MQCWGCQTDEKGQMHERDVIRQVFTNACCYVSTKYRDRHPYQLRSTSSFEVSLVLPQRGSLFRST